MADAAQANGAGDQSDLFAAIDSYPWDQDQEFQAGLRAIVGSNSEPSQVERLTLRARCFYYARKHNVNVDFPAYQAWCAARSTSNSATTDGHVHPTESQMRPTEQTIQAVSTSTEEPPPYPLSFNELVELISSGAPIPGIKEVPDTLLEGQSTTASQPKRKKPWETDSPPADESTNATTMESRSH